MLSGAANSSSICVGVMERENQLIRLAIANGRLLDRRLVAEAGITAPQWRRQVRSGNWAEVVPGVWAHLATELTWHLTARAALRRIGDDAALYGRSALVWWGLEARPPQEVEIVVPRSARRSAEAVRVHTTRWRATEYRRRDGVRLQEPATAIVCASDEGEIRWIEQMIDEAVRQRLLTEQSLRRALSHRSGSGHPGARTIRSLLLDTGGESYLERRFLSIVRAGRLPRPHCQVVHRQDGAHLARVDFLFPGTDVVVEVTGRLGHASDSERRADARRRNSLQRAGRVVLEFTTADVIEERSYVLATLKDWLRPELPLG